MKQPPHSEEAEAGVLGSVLLDPRKSPSLSTEHFFDPRNALLWSEIEVMRDSGRGMDAITIMDWLKSRGTLDRVGGFDRLLELQDEAVVTSHSQHYADIVKDRWSRRNIIKQCSEASDDAHNQDVTPERVADELVGKLIRPDVKTMSDETIHASWEKAMNGTVELIPTPFSKLNVLIGGVRQGMHTVVCGRSGSGKSMLFANWYNHLGLNDVPTLVFPFEDKYHVTKTRMAASLGGYSWGLVENGGEWVRVDDRMERRQVTQREVNKAKESLARVSAMPLHFYPSRCTPEEMFGIATKYKAKWGIKAMFVDGAKDIRRPTGCYSDTGFDEEISQELCRIAEELDIAVVSVYHLTKVPDGELIGRNHIRGSGNIVSDARLVLAFQDKGLQEAGANVTFDDEGRQTTRSIDVIKSNHSAEGAVLLETNLKKVQIWEA